MEGSWIQIWIPIFCITSDFSVIFNIKKKFGGMLHLLCHQGPLGTVCLQQDSDHTCFWPRYHLHHGTAKHGYIGIVKEWNGALLSSLMRVGSVCMRVIDVHVCGVDLMTPSSGVHSPTTHRSHLRLHGVGAISYNSLSHLVFLQGKVNSARATEISSTGWWCAFSAGQRTFTYGWCDATCTSCCTRAFINGFPK